MRGLWLILTSFLAIPESSAQAQESFLSYPNVASDHVADWSPNIFELECGPPDGPERPAQADYSCVTLATREIIELNLDRAAAYFQAQGHWSPDGLGPVIDSYAAEEAGYPAYKVVRIFTDPTDASLAYVQLMRCEDQPDMLMAVVPTVIEREPKLVVAQTSAHELHHAILHGGTPGGGCGLADWVIEGMAEALGWDYARKRVSSMFPVMHQAWKRRAVGARAYNVRLNYDFGPLDDTYYRTSSLWNHIGRRFHDGSFLYTRNYLERYSANYRYSSLGALRWLDAQLKADPKVNRGLYGVYPGFLTDYAGLFDSGDFPESFSRAEWLTPSFGKCLKAQVSPANPYVEIDLGIRAMTGRCLSVEIAGLEPQHTAFVKIGAFTDSIEVSDSLHLGFAFTNDQSGFNCAREARAGRLDRRLIGCAMEPVTGVFEHGGQSISSARMWLANAIEPGLAAQNETSAGASVENVYVLSHVPPVLEEDRMAPTQLNPNTSDPRMFEVKLGIGLEITDLAVDGQQVSDPGADRDRMEKKSRALGAVGNTDHTKDQLLYPTTGYVDNETESMSPSRSSLADPLDVMRTEGYDIRAFMASGYSPFAMLTLTDAVFDPHGLPFNVWDTHPETTYTIYVEDFGPGQTGNFEGAAFGSNKSLPAGHVLWSKRGSFAKVSVEQNSATVFRARVSATLCEYDLRDTSDGGPRCLRQVEISGGIVKPFAFLYRPNGTLRSLETPGEKLYNSFGRASLAGPTGPGGDSGSGGGDGGGGGGGTLGGGGGNSPECNCGCPRGDFIEQPRECQMICRDQWAQCPLPPDSERAGSEGDEVDLDSLLEDAGISEDARGALVQTLEAMPSSARAAAIEALQEQAR